MNEIITQPWFYPAVAFASGALVVAVIARLFYTKSLSSAERHALTLQEEISRLREDCGHHAGRAEQLMADNAGLNATLASERERHREQLALLQQTRENLTREFENLANRIFDDKQNSFNRHSKIALDATVDPLRKEISDFRKQVETAYSRESAERNKLVGQIQELKAQAQQIGDDAVQLTRALKGDSKIQGNWGEVILERLLEQSGLRKGREYETQVSLQSAEGGRRNPDVIIHLPEGRDIVVDAKVSLVDYERYCKAEDSGERQRHLNKHLLSLRAHINGLSRKAYEQLEGVNSLDFVLIFVPIESAFMIAVENDHSLFMDAYDKGIIVVSPSTLLATLRTVSNIWRFEDQNRNARKIAEQAGGLYDQFVLVVESLDDIGKHLDRGLDSWRQTRKRLIDGRGNLVKRMEDLKKMGARARKSLPDGLREEAQIDEDAPVLEDSRQDIPVEVEK